jgi:hypothetical protein
VMIRESVLLCFFCSLYFFGVIILFWIPIMENSICGNQGTSVFVLFVFSKIEDTLVLLAEQMGVNFQQIPSTLVFWECMLFSPREVCTT